MGKNEVMTSLLSESTTNFPRFLSKNGKCNIRMEGGKNARRRFLQDFFTTLVDAKWRWTLLYFALSFVISWMLFTFVWYFLAYLHGDIDPENLTAVNPDYKPCIADMETFAATFLFSLETQTTIGYGERFVTDKCIDAIVMLGIHSIVGVLIEACTAGVIITKLLRAKRRMQTVIFSRNAVINKKDQQQRLVCRVGDLQKSHIITMQIKAMCVEKSRDLLPSSHSHFTLHERPIMMGLECEDDGADVFLWPMELVHRIDEESPFYNMTQDDFNTRRFEIIVVLEGCVESTGMPIQCRTSYLPCEVLWGHKFVPMITRKLGKKKYTMDYSRFHSTHVVE